MSTPVAETAPADERAWWLRIPAVLLAPRPVFAALRDDSDETAHARQEPVAAIVGLAGISGALLSPVARHLLNDPANSPIVIPVWAFIGGTITGLAFYFVLAAFLWAAARGLGSIGSYRRARHVLAYSVVPMVLALLTFWPVRIAVYGQDLFRTGGDDYGRGDAIFGAFDLGFIAWSVMLLLIGVRTIHGWSWPRAAATVGLAAVFPALVVLASSL